MTPGNPQILTCPFCGEKKEIMTYIKAKATEGVDILMENIMKF